MLERCALHERAVLVGLVGLVYVNPVPLQVLLHRVCAHYSARHILPRLRKTRVLSQLPAFSCSAHGRAILDCSPMRRQALHYIVSARRASNRNSSDFALNSVEDQSMHGGANARHRFVPRIPRGHSFGPVLLYLLNITREQCIALDVIASASHVMIIFDCGRE